MTKTALQDLDRALDLLCPMHLRLGSTGHVRHAGPTISKICRSEFGGDRLSEGPRMLEMFELVRPRGVSTMAQLRECEGRKLQFRLRDRAHPPLKGVLVLIGAEAVLNLSFGFSIVDGVQDYALTNTDFAVTDLTMELLYLVEAKSAVMEASRSLNLRLQGAKIAAEEQAFTDTLTGLKNRRAVSAILSRLIERCTPFAVMQIDLDYFKSVNDRLGHAAGDFVLQHISQILVEETRKDDCVARVGGDEFVLIFPDEVEKEALAALAARLIGRIEKPLRYQGEICAVSASIGIALADGRRSVDEEALLNAADQALYRVKAAGRASFSFAPTEEGDLGRGS